MKKLTEVKFAKDMTLTSTLYYKGVLPFKIESSRVEGLISGDFTEGCYGLDFDWKGGAEELIAKIELLNNNYQDRPNYSLNKIH